MLTLRIMKVITTQQLSHQNTTLLTLRIKKGFTPLVEKYVDGGCPDEQDDADDADLIDPDDRLAGGRHAVQQRLPRILNCKQKQTKGHYRS
jgi:hypothetical protein